MHDVKPRFPLNHLSCSELAVLTVTDASLQVKTDASPSLSCIEYIDSKNDHCAVYRALVLAFSSAFILRACRSTRMDSKMEVNSVEYGPSCRGRLLS